MRLMQRIFWLTESLLWAPRILLAAENFPVSTADACFGGESSVDAGDFLVNREFSVGGGVKN